MTGKTLSGKLRGMESNSLASRKVLTNSSRNAFTTCAEKYRLSMVEKLKPMRDPAPLRFGTMMHSVLCAYYDALIKGLHDPCQVALDSIQPKIDAETELQNQSEFPDQKRIDDDAKAVDLIRGIMARYPSRYPDDAKKYNVIMNESVLSYRITDEWDYMGRADLLFQSKENDTHISFVDHKTSILTSPAAFAREMEFDGQLLGYCRLAKESVGILPATVIYNVIRRKLPAIPKTLKNGNLSLESGIDTTADIYCAALSEVLGVEGIIPPQYQSIIDSLERRGDTFLYRVEFPVSEFAILEWEIDTQRVCRAIDHAMNCGYLDGCWYHNYSACNAIGRRCPFIPICSQDTERGKTEIVKTMFRRYDAIAPEFEDGND